MGVAMSRFRQVQTVFLFFGALGAQGLYAGDVKTDFDPAIQFTGFKTFSFVGGQELTKTGLLSNPETRDRIKNFVSGVMQLRGLHEVPKDQKYDLAVRYWVARKQKTEVTVDFSDDYMMFAGYPPYWNGPWGWSYTEYVVNNYVEGTLIVDLIDPGTKDLVWRTFLRQRMDDPVKSYAEAKKNLEKSFTQFPPSAQDKQKMKGQREKLQRKYGNSDIGAISSPSPYDTAANVGGVPASGN
jgi:Domain of unknown function (DUF4136)